MAEVTSNVSSRVFAIVELAERIVKYAYNRESYGLPVSDPATLASLARVNKTLSPMALAPLWRFLEDAEPLVCILRLWINQTPRKKDDSAVSRQ
jgi:hypothetical protein